MIPPAKVIVPNHDLILDDIQEVLATGFLTNGKRVKEFEEAFAKAHGCKISIPVAVGSGTSALEIALRCAEVQGGEVILPTNTFAATAFAVIRAGATPVFADSLGDYSIDPYYVEKMLSEKTKAVVTVHMGGLVTPSVVHLQELCTDVSVELIEDCAHAHGCSYNNIVAGEFGLGGAFSFFPTKVITSGEGGVYLAPNEVRAARARVYRDQGKASGATNFHTQMGYNWRMSELHAVVGKYHCRELQRIVADRTMAAEHYKRMAEAHNLPMIFHMPNKHQVCNFYKVMCTLDSNVNRKNLKESLSEKSIRLAGEVYETPLHMMDLFSPYVKGFQQFPIITDLSSRQICLPLWDGMESAERKCVIESIAAALA